MQIFNKENFLSYERSFDVFESFQKAIRYIDKLGFSYRFMSTEGNFCTTAMFLNHDGPIVEEVEGLGKGIGLQSFVSSVCEAIEHYLHDNAFLQNACELFSPNELVLKNPDIQRDMGFAMLLADKEFSNKTVRTIKFRGLHNNSELNMPAFLLDPAYLEDYPENYWQNDSVATAYYSKMPPEAVKYSTNSGSALGFTLEDAVLHGLLETIERDAHSLFQIRTVFMNEWEKEVILDRSTVDKNLQYLWKDVEKLIGQKVIVFDITVPDINIPVYIALPSEKHPAHGGLHGCGCSLYPQYAIERALLEVLQVCQARGLLLEKYAITNHNKDMKNLLKYITYFNGSTDNPYVEKVLGTNNIGVLTQKCLMKKILPTPDLMSTSKQNDYILGVLLKAEFNAYAAVLDCDEVFLTHIIIPGLEKFNCIEYCVVAPGERGRSIIGID